jgi:chemotaxis protein histidine kinase CheA
VVTDVSGRGVGMDVVKRNITALSGTVEIDSAEGYGMRVSVRLPLTLAIMDGMSVGVGKEVYMLPLSSVIESFQVKADAINTVSQYQASIGAFQNRMTYQTTYVNNMKTVATTSYTNVMGYDLASETANLATAKIKQNGAMAMLAQANISQDMVSYLLKQYIK